MQNDNDQEVTLISINLTDHGMTFIKADTCFFSRGGMLLLSYENSC